MTQTLRYRVRLWRRAVIAAAMTAAFAALCPPMAAAQNRDTGETYLLAVSICPPYRKAIPPAVCRNAAKAIVDNFEKALGIEKANIISLTDEQTTARNFLKTLAELRDKLTPADRLIVYWNGHADPFSGWADAYEQDGPIAAINRNISVRNDYIMVFWTKTEPSVPALSIAQKDWLTIEEVVKAFDALPAKVALIVDSCSSARAATGFHRHAKGVDNIDYIATAAGPEQVAQFNSKHTMALFTEQLTEALDLPMVRTFGEAMSHARVATVQTALSNCMTSLIDRNDFAALFPDLPVPTAAAQKGKVALPLWFCSQAPTVVDFSGEMTRMPVYARRGPQSAQRR